MGGDFDWTGIGQGARDIGMAVRGQRQRLTAESEADAERAYRAAQLQLQMTDGLAADDPARQAAAAALEKAAQAYFKTPSFALPKTTITEGAKPATPDRTVFIPGGMARAEGVSTRQTIPGEPAQPGTQRQIYNLPGDQRVDQDQVMQLVRGFQGQIANAQQGEGRKLAIEQANAWKTAMVSRFPQLANLIPDFGAVGKRFDEEDTRTAAATAAIKSREDWSKALGSVRTRLDAAVRGTNPQLVLDAIGEFNAVISAGKQAGYIDAGARDPIQTLKLWAAHLPPMTAYQLLPVLKQFGIALTPEQQKLVDLELKKRGKSAAGTNVVVEDTGH